MSLPEKPPLRIIPLGCEGAVVMRSSFIRLLVLCASASVSQHQIFENRHRVEHKRFIELLAFSNVRIAAIGVLTGHWHSSGEIKDFGEYNWSKFQ